ncbi:hypothetical protein GJAV_G00026410 [Gymnothorax javanicus]|nr:hypothetical protein GJAV_G00026410 [Gymnothorax javanicus]
MVLSSQALLLALFLFIWVCSLTSEGAIPRCCVATSKMSPRLLRKAERIEYQSSGGVCDISAFIVHIKRRKYCVNPSMKKLIRKMRPRRKGKKWRKLRLDS